MCLKFATKIYSVVTGHLPAQFSRSACDLSRRREVHVGCCGNAWNNLKKYRVALKKWHAAGRPVRSGARIKILFGVCKQCIHFQKRKRKPWRGRCKHCGCYLQRHPHHFLSGNKIALATEHCPIGKW